MMLSKQTHSMHRENEIKLYLGSFTEGSHLGGQH